jgi:hypothetical protein
VVELVFNTLIILQAMMPFEALLHADDGNEVVWLWMIDQVQLIADVHDGSALANPEAKPTLFSSMKLEDDMTSA